MHISKYLLSPGLILEAVFIRFKQTIIDKIWFKFNFLHNKE